MKKNGDPKRILLILPTLLGIGMIIAGSATGIDGLFYTGIAVLFGGNGLLVLGSIIYVVYLIAGAAKEQVAKEKRKAEKEGRPAPRGCFGAKGCLLSALIIGAFITFPLVGMAILSNDNLIGLPIFFIGPAIIIFFAVFSGIKSRRQKREYDEELYREDIKTEQSGTVDMCIRLDTPTDGNQYFVRVNCGRDRVSAYSRTALEKGAAVRLVTYANDKVEAIAIDDGGEKPETTIDASSETAPTAKRGTHSKAKAKANAQGSAVSAPIDGEYDPPIAPIAEEQAEEEPEPIVYEEPVMPIAESITPPAAEEQATPSADDPNAAHTTHAHPTVGYRGIGKK